MFLKLFSLGVLLSVSLIVNCQESPCPGQFDYVSSGPGHWVGSLNLESEHKLHGTWIRLLFDKSIKGLEVENNTLEVAYKDDDSTAVLLKNRDLVLLKGKPTKIQFKISYDGKVPPALVTYRLNARDICRSPNE